MLPANQPTNTTTMPQTNFAQPTTTHTANACWVSFLYMYDLRNRSNTMQLNGHVSGLKVYLGLILSQRFNTFLIYNKSEHNAALLCFPICHSRPVLYLFIYRKLIHTTIEQNSVYSDRVSYILSSCLKQTLYMEQNYCKSVTATQEYCLLQTS